MYIIYVLNIQYVVMMCSNYCHHFALHHLALVPLIVNFISVSDKQCSIINSNSKGQFPDLYMAQKYLCLS